MATLTKFGCPECQTVLQLAAPVPAGKMVKCPKCGASFAAPDASAPVNRLASGNGQKRNWSNGEDDEDDTSPAPKKLKKKKLKRKEESSNKAVIWGVVIGAIVLLAGGITLTIVLMSGGDGKDKQLAQNAPAPARPNQAPAPAAPAQAPAQDPGAVADGPPALPGAGGGAAAQLPPGIENMFNKPGAAPRKGGPGGPGGVGAGLDDAEPQPPAANPGGQGNMMQEMMKRMLGGGQKPPAGGQGEGAVDPQGQKPVAGGRGVGLPPNIGNMLGRPGGNKPARPPAAGDGENPAANPGGGDGEGLEVGNLAPEIQGKDSNDKEFKLSDYRGKVVLLDFWGFW